MKILSLAALLLISIAALFYFGMDSSRAESPSSPPIVVELFTSEGCSSCPPADKLLADLERQGRVDGRQVIVMGEHVDYWDGLGWKDRFSSSVFTRRQSDYTRKLGLESAYTPQVVINGRTELVGNDAQALARGLSSQIGIRSNTLVSLQLQSPNALRVQVTGATANAHVLVGVTESGLSTHVQRGENGGRELKHAAVLRSLREVGVAHAGSFRAEVPINFGPGWIRGNLQLIVLVQESPGGVIEGAATASLP